MSKCNTCEAPIGWESEDGKWLPVNMDGTRHKRHSEDETRRAAEKKAEAPPTTGELRRTRPCRDCDDPIWFKEKPGGGWSPISIDGSVHHCEKSQKE